METTKVIISSELKLRMSQLDQFFEAWLEQLENPESFSLKGIEKNMAATMSSIDNIIQEHYVVETKF